MKNPCEIVSTEDFDKYRKLPVRDILETVWDSKLVAKWRRDLGSSHWGTYHFFNNITEGSNASNHRFLSVWSIPIYDLGDRSPWVCKRLIELFSDVELTFSNRQACRYRLTVLFGRRPPYKAYDGRPEPESPFDIFVGVQEFLAIQPNGKVTSPDYDTVKGHTVNVPAERGWPRCGIDMTKATHWVDLYTRSKEDSSPIDMASVTYTPFLYLQSYGISSVDDAERLSKHFDHSSKWLMSKELKLHIERLSEMEVKEPEKFRELQLSKSMEKTGVLVETLMELNHLKSEIEAIISGLSKDSLTEDVVKSYFKTLKEVSESRQDHRAFFKKHLIRK